MGPSVERRPAGRMGALVTGASRPACTFTNAGLVNFEASIEI